MSGSSSAAADTLGAQFDHEDDEDEDGREDEYDVVGARGGGGGGLKLARSNPIDNNAMEEGPDAKNTILLRGM